MDSIKRANLSRTTHFGENVSRMGIVLLETLLEEKIMAIIVMMLALYGFFNFVAHVGRGAKKTARKGSAVTPHHE